MPDFQSFKLEELRQAPREKAYSEFLRRPGMSMGLYVLPVDGTDKQHPHAADEVYVVLGGKASLRVGDEVQEVSEGTVISVDRGVDHSFTDISEDLHVLVIFAPAEVPEA